MAHWSEDREHPNWKIAERISRDMTFIFENDDLVQKFHETKDPVYWDRMIERYKTRVSPAAEG